MKCAVLIDPLETLDPTKDTSLAFLAAAEQLGWRCYYFTIADLCSDNNRVLAALTQIHVAENMSTWTVDPWPHMEDLSHVDIILVRKDPPFDLAYLYAMQLLKRVADNGVLVSNHPYGILQHNEKLSILSYPDLCVPTLVSADIKRLKEFWQIHTSVIYKPLNAMGGENVIHIAEDGRNLSVALQWLTAHQTMPIMAQRYIADIDVKGDKRIILINGEPIPYALARFAAPLESRANLAAGGRGVVVPISERDRFICQTVAEHLRAQGLHFVGIDVIGEYLTEINVTSPTCVRQIAAETGLTIAEDYLQFLAAQAE